MRKKLLSAALALCLMILALPIPHASAASYSVDKAIAYAQEHWDDGVGLCAEFVSRCVRAGGLDMKVITTAGSCLNTAAEVSGLQVYDLKLNSSGYATKADNSSILNKGDIVAQYCYTHDKYPHVMICGGYDSSGIATFYAHNGAMNNERYKLNQNLAYEHTKSCNMQARVVHLSSLDAGVSSGGVSAVMPDDSGVSFSLPTDSNYTSKQMITNTNAVVVNKVNKPSGVSVTRMGVVLMNNNDGKIFDHSEYVTNVKDSTTTYHSWFDINSELHVTLTPGTKYKYQFYGYFDGKKVSGPTYTFTTTGKAPVARFWLSDTEYKTVVLVTGYAYHYQGDFPQAYEKDGYTFAGWYTDPVGGTKISMSSIYTGTSDVDLYPHYTKNAVSEPEVDVSAGADMVVNPDVEPEPEPEPETYTLVYMDLRTMISYGTYTVQNGDKYPIPSKTPTRDGYEFAGWYTSATGGTRVTASTTVNLTKDQDLYPHWIEVKEEPDTNVLTLQIGSPYLFINGARQNIDAQGTVPLLRNDRTLLPVRAVVEAMGGTVGWIGSSETVVMTMDGKSLNLQIGNNIAWSGTGTQYTMDVAPILVNDRTMLPIRFVVEYFGGTVLWDNATQTVTVEYEA